MIVFGPLGNGMKKEQFFIYMCIFCEFFIARFTKPAEAAPDAVDRDGVKNSNYNKGLVSRGSAYNDTRCDRLGFKYDDRAKRCVDVNECYTPGKPYGYGKCRGRDACVNYKGNFRCFSCQVEPIASDKHHF